MFSDVLQVGIRARARVALGFTVRVDLGFSVRVKVVLRFVLRLRVEGWGLGLRLGVGLRLGFIVRI